MSYGTTATILLEVKVCTAHAAPAPATVRTAKAKDPKNVPAARALVSALPVVATPIPASPAAVKGGSLALRCARPARGPERSPRLYRKKCRSDAFLSSTISTRKAD